MPKRSDPFQTLVAQIQLHLSQDKALSVEESAFLKSESTGEMREVDVVVSGNINGVDVTISFEVCDRARPAGSNWVESMIGKHAELQTNVLVLVSNSGLTKPATKLVGSKKWVEYANFEEASSVDWGNYADKLSSLRFGGYDLIPLSLEVELLDTVNSSGKRFPIVSSTIFRNRHDNLEVNAIQFVGAFLRDPRVSRPIMDRFVSHEKFKQIDADGEGEVFVLEGEARPRIEWTAEESNWELDFAEGTFAVKAATVALLVQFKSTPIDLSFRNFMGTRLASAIIDAPFADNNTGTRAKISFAVSLIDNKDTVGSISYTRHADGSTKTKLLQQRGD